ncbi:MAG: XRE family transcriptional regulator [Steroidobacter sp.]
MEKRIAEGLQKRREYLGLTTQALADQSGVSRAMISKIERHEASPTAALLGRLCNALGITLSSLIANAETESHSPVARADEQPVWKDPDTGLHRIMVSPLNTGSRVEIVRIELPAGAEVKYDPQRHAMFEQHIMVFQGKLNLTIGAEALELAADDCVYMKLDAPVRFSNRGRSMCRYLVIINR